MVSADGGQPGTYTSTLTNSWIGRALGSSVGTLALVVVPEDADAARALARQPDDRVDRRRFSRAVGPEKAEELARLDSQRDAVDGREASVTFDEPSTSRRAIAMGLGSLIVCTGDGEGWR